MPTSESKIEIVKYIEAHYPNCYSDLSNNGHFSYVDTWKIISREIEYSKKHHGGMDMSGLVELLLSIKLERLALGYLGESTKLYSDQWERFGRDYEGKKDFDRNDNLCPYTKSRMRSGNAHRD